MASSGVKENVILAKPPRYDGDISVGKAIPPL